MCDSPLTHTIMQSAPGHIIHSCNLIPPTLYSFDGTQCTSSVHCLLHELLCLCNILVVQTMTMVRVSFAYAASLGRKTA